MANKSVFNLSGGMNTKTSPLIIRDSECELILNYRLDPIGALTKRPGYDVFASQPVAGKRVHGLYQYTNSSTPAETTQVMVVNNSGNTNSVIYYNNSSTWSTSKTNDTAVSTFTNFNRARFETFLDYIFRVNGQDVTATSNNVNGSSWGTTNAPGTIKPSFIKVFQDRVYTAHGDQAGEQSRVWFSQLPTSSAISWDTANDFFDVNPDDGDEITGLDNNGNRLLMFKTFSMYRWVYGQVEADRLIGVGTSSQECVKTNLDLGITFFANQRGVYAYTGGRPKLISRKIQKWFDAVPAADLNDFCAEVDDDHYYLYLSDSLTVDGRTYTNVLVEYTVSLDGWTVWTLNKPVRWMARLILSGEEGIYFGSSNGRTYKLLEGTADDSGGANGDEATPIAGEIIFKEHLLTFPEKTEIRYVDIIASGSPTANAQIYIDRNKDADSLGSLVKTVNTFRIGREARFAKLRVTDNSQRSSVIEAYNFEHSPKEERKDG